MKLENLDDVTAFRNHRKRAADLREAARTGPITCTLHYFRAADPFSVISAEPVRQAIIEACTDFIAEIDGKLRALGVSTAHEPPPARDASSWKRDCEMFVRAWIRELGGRLIPKSHLIDALVLTTRQLREKAEAPATRAVDWLERTGIDETEPPSKPAEVA